MSELDRAELCGPRDAKDPEREHVRNGTTATSVVLGGRRVPIRGPRVAATDGGFGIALDGAGNTYTTGFFSGTVDFDPGPGVTNLTSNGSTDVFITKLDPNGDLS